MASHRALDGNLPLYQASILSGEEHRDRSIALARVQALLSPEASSQILVRFGHEGRNVVGHVSSVLFKKLRVNYPDLFSGYVTLPRADSPIDRLQQASITILKGYHKLSDKAFSVSRRDARLRDPDDLDDPDLCLLAKGDASSPPLSCQWRCLMIQQSPRASIFRGDPALAQGF